MAKDRDTSDPVPFSLLSHSLSKWLKHQWTNQEEKRKKEDSLSSNFQELISYAFQLSSVAVLSRGKCQEAIGSVTVSSKRKVPKFAWGFQLSGLQHSVLSDQIMHLCGWQYLTHQPLLSFPQKVFRSRLCLWEAGLYSPPNAQRVRVATALSPRKGWCAPRQSQTTSPSSMSSGPIRLRNDYFWEPQIGMWSWR